jgi:predicted NBD/HSP70 family sugar kinase
MLVGYCRTSTVDQRAGFEAQIRDLNEAGCFPLVAELTQRLDVPVTAMNDAQAAAWGDYRHGAGRDCDMVFLTVSTGIGGGIVLGGRLITGRSGLSGHAGQMLVGLGGENQRFEDAASGLALRREAIAVGHDVESEAICAVLGRKSTPEELQFLAVVQ